MEIRSARAEGKAKEYREKFIHSESRTKSSSEIWLACFKLGAAKVIEVLVTKIFFSSQRTMSKRIV